MPIAALPLVISYTASVAQAADTRFNDPGFNKIVWVDSPNFNHRAKAAEIDTIVLHHTAGPTLGGTVNWFKD
ncbi:hypothetical protein ABTN73_19970, partial [Acinetobacter baumannii]